MLTFQELYNTINEAREWSGNYVDLAWFKGGIPDLSGVASVLYPAQEPLLWKTPTRNIGSSQIYKAALLDNGKLVFFKHPAKFTRENILPKLERYLKDNYDYTAQIVKIFQVNPSVINKIGKESSTIEEYKKVGGEKMAQRSSKMDGMGERLARVGAANAGKKYVDPDLVGGTREEVNAKIKEKANALAREKMKILMANGVSREDALSAAKEAYKKFIADYRNKYYDNLGSGPNRVISTNTTHPLMTQHGNAIKSVRSAGAKEAMQNAYRRALNNGKSKEEAKAEAIALYNKMMGN